MSAPKITWANKVSIDPKPTIPEINKVTDDNMNNIKSVVDKHADLINKNTAYININGTKTYNPSGDITLTEDSTIEVKGTIELDSLDDAGFTITYTGYGVLIVGGVVVYDGTPANTIINFQKLIANKSTYGVPLSKGVDPSLATVTENTTDPTHTNEFKYKDNPEFFQSSGYFNKVEASNSVRLASITEKPPTAGNLGDGTSQLGASYTFYTDASSFTLRHLGNDRVFHLFIDGVLLQKDFFNLAAGDINVDFGSSKTRLVTVYVISSVSFGTILVKPTETVWNPHKQNDKIMIIGDSFSVGSGSGNTGFRYPLTLMSYFGWTNVMLNGTGATGFINDAGGTKYNYVQRIPDIQSYNPDYIIINCSLNDSGFLAGLPDAFSDWHSQVRLFSNATIIVLGIPSVRGGGYENLEQAVSDRIKAIGDNRMMFIPSLTGEEPMPIVGTGKVGNETGDGNADIYMGDNVHYSADGYVLWGEWMAKKLETAISSL